MIPELWPNAKYVYGIMTGSMDPYARKLQRYAGSLPVLSAYYGASEGWIHANVNPRSKLEFENELVIAIGKGEPVVVMSEYGFKKVLSIDEYTSYFEDIDPLSQFKCWATRQANEKNTSRESHLRYNVYSQRVKGVFVFSDPVDWGRDIQVSPFVTKNLHLLSI
ncbi:uncharacterized protein A4U43_C05F16000 [Asparagus officinalis]|uniref:Uncharacterized protein n=1 Tax=Asparagus officinalis TaxID=4686 RepID=A0A5P1ERY4_ASPOF|nr:uncharacterized protein A4U43_C05F16000 [Asparagus officinalis]